MRRDITAMALAGTLLLGSCGTYTGSGAYMGASLGSILGSAIGGISDGPRGSDLGTIIGMAGGAALGAAIGSSADQAREERVQEDVRQMRQHRQQRQQQQDDSYYTPQGNSYNGQGSTQDDSGFDPSNSGDDRIYDFQGSDYTGSYSASKPTTSVPAESSVDDLVKNYTYNPHLEILNARFVDSNQDGALSRNEIGKVIFEITNSGKLAVSDLVPTVVVVSGNRHIYVSPSLHIESIAPEGKIRYTAIVKADGKLKPGSEKFALSVLQGGNKISDVVEFDITTKK